MNTFKSIAVISILVAAASAGAANPTMPAGTEGKDYASESFNISSGSSVVITATNITTTEQSGNSTRVILNVNGKPVLDQSAEKAQMSASYMVTGNGSYDVTAVCHNGRANANSCSITLEKKAVHSF